MGTTDGDAVCLVPMMLTIAESELVVTEPRRPTKALAQKAPTAIVAAQPVNTLDLPGSDTWVRHCPRRSDENTREIARGSA